MTRYRLLGYENRAIPDRHFRDPATDGGEIGLGHQVTAVYEVELAQHADGGRGWWPWAGDRGGRGHEPFAELDLLYKPAAGAEPVEQSAQVARGDVGSGWSEASPGLRLAVVVGRFAEILRQLPSRAGELDGLLAEAQALVGELPDDRRVIELAHLVGKARDLVASR